MNTDKKIIDKEVVIYVYSKDDESAKTQSNILLSFCTQCKLNTKNVYVDKCNKNILENKNNLKKLIKENRNINVVVLDFNRLSRDYMDLISLYDLCKEKDIDFYDARMGKFLFDDYFITLKDIYE